MCKELDKNGDCITCGMPPHPIGKFTPYGGYGIPNMKWKEFVDFIRLQKHQENWLRRHYSNTLFIDDDIENHPLPSKVFSEIIYPSKAVSKTIKLSKIRGKKADLILMDDLLDDE